MRCGGGAGLDAYSVLVGQRQSLQRLRAVLGLVPGEEARTARAELKRYGQVLGAARDFEVRAELAAKLLEDVADADEDDDGDGDYYCTRGD